MLYHDLSYWESKSLYSPGSLGDTKYIYDLKEKKKKWSWQFSLQVFAAVNSKHWLCTWGREQTTPIFLSFHNLQDTNSHFMLHESLKFQHVKFSFPNIQKVEGKMGW